MIVYQNTKNAFIDDVVSNNIENIIHEYFQNTIGYSTSNSEINSWRNSMQYMSNILLDPDKNNLLMA